MKQKITALAAVVAFALLLGGAYLLYNNLREGTDTDQLSTLPQTNQTTPSQSTQPTETTQPTENVTPSESPAPTMSTQWDFTVYDGQGQLVKLSDFVGKPIVLNFWASWCGPCKSEMPEFQETYEELKDQVHFVMVNATGGRETVDTAKSFISQSGYTFPVFYDTAGEASARYQVYSLPTTYFFSADGVPVTYAIGAIDKTTLLKGIGMITE